MNSVLRVRVIISGRVQGVGFRRYARSRAEELGLSGWVRNLADGRVEAVFQGNREAVADMLEWCRHGSPASEVRHLQTMGEFVTDCGDSFEIR